MTQTNQSGTAEPKYIAQYTCKSMVTIALPRLLTTKEAQFLEWVFECIDDPEGGMIYFTEVEQ